MNYSSLSQSLIRSKKLSLKNIDFFTEVKIFFYSYRDSRSLGVISSDSPCKDNNARFTTFPLKALSDQG